MDAAWRRQHAPLWIRNVCWKGVIVGAALASDTRCWKALKAKRRWRLAGGGAAPSPSESLDDIEVIV